MLDSIGKTFKALLQIARRYYQGLSLQLKFALVIGSINFAVILLLSLAVLEAEKRVLRQKVDEICKLSAQSLSIVAEDNLLLDNNVPIQEVINNMVELKLEGFESEFVMDRNGVIVAHSDVSMINQEKKEYLAYLDSQDLLSVIEHENNTEYLNAIPITIERDGETKRGEYRSRRGEVFTCHDPGGPKPFKKSSFPDYERCTHSWHSSRQLVFETIIREYHQSCWIS